MVRVLRDRRIVLGVTGSIAVYKALDFVRQLTQAGAQVDVVMTAEAQAFVTALTFQTLTRRPVHTTAFEAWDAEQAGHVTLGANADIMIIAPATAQSIARLAHGFADDAVSLTALACPAPLIVAPAMDHYMYWHPAMQANLETLKSRGVILVGPDHGPLASGMVGDGRMASIDEILAVTRKTLGRTGPLAGRRVVVTAGPTREFIDPIRFLTNASSGRMGYALAEAARDAGADVLLITGPTALPDPKALDVVHVTTAQEMYGAVKHAVQAADVLIMAAAVSDYRPRYVVREKIKKEAPTQVLELERTVDILREINQPGLLKIGFAAETEQLISYAQEKLHAKNLDMIVANDAREAMGSEFSSVVLITAEGIIDRIERQSKVALAEAIIDHVAAMLRTRVATDERTP